MAVVSKTTAMRAHGSNSQVGLLFAHKVVLKPFQFPCLHGQNKTFNKIRNQRLLFLTSFMQKTYLCHRFLVPCCLGFLELRFMSCFGYFFSVINEDDNLA